MKSRIYLDHAATTPASPAALAALATAAAAVGNPASVHAGGRAVNAIVERARDTVADWAGCRADNLIFTSGGSEALALALNSPLRVLAGTTEHTAVLAARPDATLIPVDGNGLIDLEALAAALRAGPAIVAIQHANNETGVIQPIGDIAGLVATAGSRLLVDAVQSAGKLPLPKADYVAISAHKLGGITGTGALIARDIDTLRAVQRGGGQERGLRGGTPNVPGIAAFAAAVAEPPDWETIAALRVRMEADLLSSATDAFIAGTAVPRLPNIINIIVPGLASVSQVMALDIAGFMISAGAACSSGKVASSHVLAAMGFGATAGNAIRISLGPATTAAEVDAFGNAWRIMTNQMRRRTA